MKYYNKVLCVSLVIALSFITACAPKIIPRPSQEGSVDLESNIITKEKGGVKISVQTEEWRFPPYSLNDYFTPFLFLIRNNTENKMSIKYNGFILFDEHGNQYEAVSPGNIEYMMGSRDLYGNTYPDVFFRFEETRPPYTYGLEAPAYLRKPFSNISLLSLPETVIYPNSQVRGFVYFRKAITYGKGLKLRVELDGFADEFEFDIKK